MDEGEPILGFRNAFADSLVGIPGQGSRGMKYIYLCMEARPMAKFWIRGLFALLMSFVIVGGLSFVALYAVDRQVEISRLEIESWERIELANIEACSKTVTLCFVGGGEPTPAKPIEPEPDPVSSKSSSSALRRLPEVEEPTVVRPQPQRWDPIPSPRPWPGYQATPSQRDPYTESLERRLTPPEIKPPETVPKPFAPGSTNPDRRKDFRRRERSGPTPVGSVAAL